MTKTMYSKSTSSCTQKVRQQNQESPPPPKIIVFFSPIYRSTVFLLTQNPTFSHYLTTKGNRMVDVWKVYIAFGVWSGHEIYNKHERERKEGKQPWVCTCDRKSLTKTSCRPMNK